MLPASFRSVCSDDLRVDDGVGFLTHRTEPLTVCRSVTLFEEAETQVVFLYSRALVVQLHLLVSCLVVYIMGFCFRCSRILHFRIRLIKLTAVLFCTLFDKYRKVVTCHISVRIENFACFVNPFRPVARPRAEGGQSFWNLGPKNTPQKIFPYKICFTNKISTFPCGTPSLTLGFCLSRGREPKI